MLNEDAIRGRSVILQGQQRACYIHVDDGIVLGSGNVGSTDKVMHGCADALAARGFVTEDRTPDGELTKVIGYSPQRHPARLNLPQDRAVQLALSLRALARAPQVDVDLLRSVIGVWVWAALLRRDLLSIPQAVFGFIQKFEGTIAPWWPSARREVHTMSCVVIAMYADLGAELAQTVFATDAMGSNETDCGGYGVVVADVDRATVRDCYEEGLQPGFTVCRLDGKFYGLKNPHSKIGRNVPFTRIPPAMLEASWEPLLWGRWTAADHITLGEGRTVVKLLELMTLDARCHRHKVLSLQDNRPIVGAFTKGRSPTGGLNRLCRQKTAFCCAAEIQVLLPWVQSPVMPADSLSRQIDASFTSQVSDSNCQRSEAKSQQERRPQG